MDALTRADILEYASAHFGTEPEYLWERTPDSAVLRHAGNRKWYALLMEVPRERLGLPGEGGVEILNLKCEPALIGALRTKEGYLPGYHMNKESWITLRLDGTVERAEGLQLLELSFQLTETKWKQTKKKRKQKEKTEGVSE